MKGRQTKGSEGGKMGKRKRNRAKEKGIGKDEGAKRRY